ncbi:MAG: PEP-CTERM sorting domain-containing protein [Verrucomicrobiota bacterium JB023]|nr:PEP-CTERM sorting domain-containing protein [Verrucomicrobiota bacterium JB023]
MKTTITLVAVAFTSVGLNAATVTATPGDPAGGAGYTYHLTLGNGDQSQFVGTVGSWSWHDASVETDPENESLGWRHQSDWFYVTLTEATTLSLNFSRHNEVDDAKLFPSFTLYEGLADTNGFHTFPNQEDIQWSPETNLLTYLTHFENDIDGSLSADISLPAGSYTIAFGGNATSEASPVNVNYSALISASPIPEPSTALFSTLGLFALLRRRR